VFLNLDELEQTLLEIEKTCGRKDKEPAQCNDVKDLTYYYVEINNLLERKSNVLDVQVRYLNEADKCDNILSEIDRKIVKLKVDLADVILGK
jgi:hypothetical protein